MWQELYIHITNFYISFWVTWQVTKIPAPAELAAYSFLKLCYSIYIPCGQNGHRLTLEHKIMVGHTWKPPYFGKTHQPNGEMLDGSWSFLHWPVAIGPVGCHITIVRIHITKWWIQKVKRKKQFCMSKRHWLLTYLEKTAWEWLYCVAWCNGVTERHSTCCSKYNLETNLI